MAGARIQVKRSLAASWTAANTVLFAGEIGLETDTRKFKIGDGSTAWTSLAYSSSPLSEASINDLGDVTITNAQDGDFLRWNGTAFVNDAVDLGTDTTGNFMSDVVGGTGVTVTHTPGEGSSASVAIGQDVATSASVEFAALTVNGQTRIGGHVLPDENETFDLGSASFRFRDIYLSGNTIDLGGAQITSDGTAIAFSGEISVGGGANLVGDLTGNADTASTLETARTISLGGDLSGSVSFDGSADVTITATVEPDSVELGVDTTGNFMSDVVGGTGVTVSHTPGESSSASIAIGQDVATSASPSFALVTISGEPTEATHAVTKAYADAIAAGINWHESVELATATALPNSPTYDNGTSGVGSTLTATSNGRLLVDGINATTGDRILVKDQATGTQNGIYVVTAQGAAGATYLLTRATDHDGAGDNIVRGDAVYVGNGSSNVNQGFLINSVGSSGAKELHVVGTDDITFTQFTGTANINAGTGVTKTGNTLSIGQSVATNSSVTFTQVTAALVGNASTATTLATARNIAGQSFDGSGNISIAPTDLTGVTSTAAELNILDGVTSTAAELNILDGVTSTAAELNILDGATLTVTELNHVDGVTSAIQTQIDLKAPLASPTFTGTVTVPTPVNNTDAATKAYVDGEVAGASINTLDEIGDVTITSATAGDFLKFNGAAFVNDQIDLGTDTVGNYVSGVTAGTGITVTHTPSEGSSPTIAVTANTFDAFGAASTAASNAGTALSNHEADTTNIHGIADTSILVTTTGTQTLTNKTITSPSGLVKGDVGLGNVANTNDASKPVSTAQQTALNLKANLASPTFTGTVTIPTGASITAPTGLVKGDVGLGSVDNTADTAKPVSTAQQTALNLKANLASPTFTGTPTLPTGTIATTQTAGNNSTAVATTAFVSTAVANLVDSAPATLNTLDELAAALGDDPSFATTVSNNIGLKAPLASPTFTGTVTIPTGASITAPTGLVKGDVGLSSVNNTADTAKPVSTAQQTALNLKANLASPTFTGTPTLPTGTIATTQTAADSSTKIATTAFATTALNLKANLASPTFTGTVTVPTPTNGTDAATKTYADGVVTAANIITAAGGDGTNGQALTTNGAGTLDFITITGTTEASIISAVGADGSSGQVLKTNGSGDLSFGDVALGTNTTGNFMSDVLAGTGISITHTPSEGSTATISLADVVTNAQTASYTLVLDDKNKIVEMNVASANNLTIPPNSSVAFPVGSQINILQVGAGQTTVVAGAGVTVNGTPGLKVRTQFSYVTCIKRATNTWVLVGDLSA